MFTSPSGSWCPGVEKMQRESNMLDEVAKQVLQSLHEAREEVARSFP